ncbi:MAG: hypothetical protein Q9168_004597 [Polycauliona sp. 1 TL-2023]
MRFLSQTPAELVYAHNFFHRDIKPEDIFISTSAPADTGTSFRRSQILDWLVKHVRNILIPHTSQPDGIEHRRSFSAPGSA